MVSQVLLPKRLVKMFQRAILMVGLGTALSVNADVRILLDVSRSMAENDPGRTRLAAIEMVIDNLPNSERAGIWTFGQYVNLLVPHDSVNDQWRAQAKASIAQLTSPAVRTNMGRALEDAAYDFDFSTYSGAVDTILITDGNVDIAPNANVNQVERTRILSQVVDRYASANAKIHTIALSDQADMSLLRQLSEQTGGQFQQVESGQNMTLAVLGLVTEISPSSQLPIQQNAFVVDESVDEIVALLYHQAGLAVLTSPSGQVTSALSPGNQRWMIGNGYTQVAVTRPAAGRWQIAGVQQQSGNVRVFSDISLEWTSPVSAGVAKGSVVTLEAALLGPDGESIASDLAPIIRASMRVDGLILPTQVVGDRIIARLQPNEMASAVNVELLVEGGTFNRLLNRQIRFVEPYLSEVLMTEKGYEWRLYPNRLLGEVDGINAVASYTINGGQQGQFELQDAGYWLWVLPYTAPNGNYEVTLSGSVIQGGTSSPLLGEVINLILPATGNSSMAMTPNVMAADSPVSNPAPMADTSAAFLKDPMPVFEELQADIVVAQPDMVEADDWNEEPVEASKGLGMMTYVLLSIPGVLVLVIAYVVYRRYEKKSASNADGEENIMGGDEFSGLDDPQVLMQDNDLDLSQLDDDGDFDLDAEADADADIPVMDDQVDDDIPVMDEPLNIDTDIPPPETTEAPSVSEEDMLDVEPATASNSLLDGMDEDDILDIEEEELFDISSIDDDLSDLDLALDGDDPFALDDDPKP